MSCEEHRINLSAFMDGEASPADVRSALDHMGACATCRGFLSEAMSHRTALRQAPLPDFPDSLDHRIRRATDTRVGRRREMLPIRLLPGWRLAIPVPALAVIIVYLLTATALALSSLFGPPGRRETEPTFLYVRELPPVEVVGVTSDESEPARERRVLQ
jgi:anti-sigma factor RsiW